MKKNFDEWFKIKPIVNNNEKIEYFRQRDIWWCSFGINVGTEIDGKSKIFSRPVLIFRKISRNNFWGLPLTTKNKSGTWYTSIKFNGSRNNVILSQIRLIDKKRLIDKMGELDIKDYEKVKNQFSKLL